jgi:hypothetical protein
VHCGGLAAAAAAVPGGPEGPPNGVQERWSAVWPPAGGHPVGSDILFDRYSDMVLSSRNETGETTI